MRDTPSPHRLATDYGISRAEADRIAETVVRSMWATGHLTAPETP